MIDAYKNSDFNDNSYLIKVTNGTNDEPRWIRLWWEVEPQKIGRFKNRIPHARGGSSSPYYGDWYLLVSWDEKTKTYLAYQGTSHRPDIRPANLEFFFRSALTWSRRTNGLGFRILPSKAIFGNKSPAILDVNDNKKTLLALSGNAPELSDPLAPLPFCPPGMLQNAEGFPALPKDSRTTNYEL